MRSGGTLVQSEALNTDAYTSKTDLTEMITSRPHCCMSVSGSQSDWFRVRAEFWPILRTVNGMWIH